MARLSDVMAVLNRVHTEFGDYQCLLSIDGILRDIKTIEWDDMGRMVLLLDAPTKRQTVAEDNAAG